MTVSAGGINFQIKESFGPFESDNLKLLLTTSRSGLILLAVGKCKIYGIALEGGEVIFELQIDEIKTVIDIVEGCLLCLDSNGRFKLIEIFYETGQVLATWKLQCENVKLVIDSVSVKSKLSGSKFNLTVKLSAEASDKVVAVFTIDPASEVTTCTFRHWILTDQDEKPLPVIVHVIYSVHLIIIPVELVKTTM